MKESAKTLIYAVVAATAVGGAWYTHDKSKPSAVAGFERVGEDFFATFEDPTLAKSLRVVAFDEDTAMVREFEVKQQASGEWVIPSRHDYPADGEDRLAKTAASIIGIKRGALASRYEDDFEKHGVIEPEDEDGAKLTGRGQRITLKDDKDEVLADYIIGKKVENPAGHYYVRVPGEKETYISKFEVDLSTTFTDWIDDDLLSINESDLVELNIDKYSIDEQQGTIEGEETNVLTRAKSGDPWVLEGLKDDTEELKTAEITAMVSTLDSLKAVGVRPKPKGINADLTVSRAVAQNRLLQEALQNDLNARGFRIGPKAGGEEGIRLYANEGELTASTNSGISYTLRFGEIFTGSQDEIESGFAKGEEDNKDADDKDGDSSKPDDVDGPDTKRSRYIFVSTSFDERFLTNKPVKPTEPPEFEKEDSGDAAKDAKSEDAKDDGGKDDAKDTDKKPDDASADDAADDGKEKSDDDAKDGEDNKDEDNAAAIREAYEAELKKYESDLKAFEKTVADGKTKAKELNERFAAWYYVISADSFEKLRLSRDVMVQAKETPAEDKPADPGAKAGAPADATTAPAANDETPMKQGKDDKPSKDAPKDATSEAKPKTEVKPKSKPEEKAADVKPEAKPPEQTEPTPAKETAPVKETAPAKETPKPGAADKPVKPTETPDSGATKPTKPTKPEGTEAGSDAPKVPEKPTKPASEGADPAQPTSESKE